MSSRDTPIKTKRELQREVHKRTKITEQIRITKQKEIK